MYLLENHWVNATTRVTGTLRDTSIVTIKSRMVTLVDWGNIMRCCARPATLYSINFYKYFLFKGSLVLKGDALGHDIGIPLGKVQKVKLVDLIRVNPVSDPALP